MIRTIAAAMVVLLSLVLLLLCGSGCGEGDTLPLVPVAGICDRPPDPHWRTLSPLCDAQTQKDAVWTADGKVCVVGARGLVLLKQDGLPFLREKSGTANDLNSVTADPSGTIIAVGSAGTVAERGNSAWTSRQVTGVGDLRTVVFAGQRAWAVGDGGSVITRDPQGQWSIIDTPTEADLTGVAVKGDTLVVSGAGGALLLRAGGQWTDLSAGPWLDATVHSVVWLDHGPLVAAADMFYVSDQGGWSLSPLGQEPWFGTGRQVKYMADRLWVIRDNNVVKIDPLTEEWSWESRYFNFVQGSIGVRDSSRAILVSSQGPISWYEEGLDLKQDLAGMSEFYFFHFLDGTVGVYNHNGLIVMGSLGLTYVQEYEADLQEAIHLPRCLAGRSLDDYFLAYGHDIYHLRNGEANLAIRMEDESVRDMVLDAQGRLHISTNAGIFCWDGTDLELTLAVPENSNWPRLAQTILGTPVARASQITWYLAVAGWVPLEGLSPFVTSETAPGDLLFLQQGTPPSYQIRRVGQGLLAEGSLDPAPGCGNLGFEGGVDDLRGVYIFSRFPSLVFRLEGDPILGNWNLVAGPLESEIDELKIMPDGSLLVRTNNPMSSGPDALRVYLAH